MQGIEKSPWVLQLLKYDLVARNEKPFIELKRRIVYI